VRELVEGHARAGVRCYSVDGTQCVCVASMMGAKHKQTREACTQSGADERAYTHVSVRIPNHFVRCRLAWR